MSAGVWFDVFVGVANAAFAMSFFITASKFHALGNERGLTIFGRVMGIVCALGAGWSFAAIWMSIA